MGARLPAGTAQTGQENRPLSDGRFSVFSREKRLKPISFRSNLSQQGTRASRRPVEGVCPRVSVTGKSSAVEIREPRQGSRISPGAPMSAETSVNGTAQPGCPCNQTRSMRVNNQPNFPLMTAASQKGQMLVMSTLTDAPQLGQACEVMFPGLPVSAREGR